MVPELLCYMPTYSPYTEADTESPRPYTRLTNKEIAQRMGEVQIKRGTIHSASRSKPWMYMDAIDSILNVNPKVELVVVDGRSTDSIRNGMQLHHKESGAAYHMSFYPEKMSQWVLFNDVLKKHAKEDTKYFIYTSSDVYWFKDWVSTAIQEFEKNPRLMIGYPCVNSGDPNLPCQIAAGPRDMDPIAPPYQEAAKAPVLNAYAMIFRMDFLRTYGGYPTLFRNCYSESFLHFMCEAMGGEMLLLPRCWCWHWGAADVWQENGSYYHYNEDKSLFLETMASVKMAQGCGIATPDFYKKALYK